MKNVSSVRSATAGRLAPLALAAVGVWVVWVGAASLWLAALQVHYPWRAPQLLTAGLAFAALALAVALAKPTVLVQRGSQLLSALALLLGAAALPATTYMHTVQSFLPTTQQFDTGPRTIDALRSARRAPIPELWFPDLLPEDEAALVGQIQQGQLVLLGKPAVDISSGIDWGADPFGDRTWQLMLHSLNYVRPLVAAYRRSADPRLLHLAGQILEQWIGANSHWFFSPPSDFSWNDHAMAFRALAMLDYATAAAASGEPLGEGFELVLRGLAGHGQALANPLNYTPRHNHGIDQDIALLAVASAFPHWAQSASWRTLAIKRLKGQISDTISSRGVHLEHSPAYHLTTLTHLLELYRLAKHFGIAAFDGSDFVALLRRMSDFAQWVVLPNDRVLSIGDSMRSQGAEVFNQRLLKLTDGLPELKGLTIKPDVSNLPKGLRVYREEGYALFFGVDAAGRRSHFVSMTAMMNPGLAHKHADELAVTVMSCQREVLVDHGGYGYNYDKWREYFLNKVAHNTVSLSAVPTEGLLIRQDRRPRITAVSAVGDVQIVRAEALVAPDLKHRRTLMIAGTGDILIHDRLVSSSRAAARKLSYPVFAHWHFDAGLNVALTGDRILVTDANASPLAAIAITSLPKASVERFEGSINPLLGWTSYERNQARPSPTIQVQLGSDAKEFVTAISLPADCDAPKVQSPSLILSGTVDLAESTVLMWKTGAKEFKLTFSSYSELPQIEPHSSR